MVGGTTPPRAVTSDLRTKMVGMRVTMGGSQIFNSMLVVACLFLLVLTTILMEFVTIWIHALEWLMPMGMGFVITLILVLEHTTTVASAMVLEMCTHVVVLEFLPVIAIATATNTMR